MVRNYNAIHHLRLPVYILTEALQLSSVSSNTIDVALFLPAIVRALRRDVE
jgi:hypothetical protein